MKYLLIAAIIIFVTHTVKAQYRGEPDNKKFFISLGGEIGAPSNTPFSISYGGSFQAEAKFTDRFAFTLAGEYTGYKYKGAFGVSSNIEQHPSLTPLKAGLRYYTTPGFFFSGEMGTSLQNNDINAMLVYSLGFGFEIPVNKLSDVEIGFSYQNYAQSQYQTTGLRAAYRLGW
jgi:hypothetical protein